MKRSYFPQGILSVKTFEFYVKLIEFGQKERMLYHMEELFFSGYFKNLD